MEVNTGQQQPQRVEVFTIDEIDEPPNHWRKIAIIQAILILIVKTQRNSTQLKATLKQLALELDIVVTCSTTHICCGTSTQTLLLL